MDTATKNRRMQRMAENMDRDAVLELAALTIINVHDLQNAANTLLEKELFGQARSMGIMAIEELGKFVQTLNYLAGGSDPLNFVNNSWSHQSKQRSGYVIALLSSLLVDLQKQKPLGPEEKSLELSFANITDRITENIEQLVIEFERQVPELEQLIKETESGEIEYRRQDGFYVSLAIDELNRISVKHPRLVTREEAVFFIKLLSILNDSNVSLMLEPLVMNYSKCIDSENESLPAVISILKKMIDDAVRQLKTLPDSSKESCTEKQSGTDHGYDG